MAMSRIPSQELGSRIGTLREEIETTHPKSPRLKILTQIEDKANKAKDRIFVGVVDMAIGELIIGLVAYIGSRQENFAFGAVGIAMATFLLGTVGAEIKKQRVIATSLAELDKVMIKLEPPTSF